MKKAITSVLIVLLMVTSCKKKQELPEQSSEEPVFHLTYLIDGQSQHLEAGNLDYFMTTSWMQDSNLIYVLRGDLAQTSGTAARGNAISILLNDLKPSLQNSAINLDSILRIGTHLLNDKFIAGTSQTVSFIPEKKFDPTASYVWELTDGNTDQRTVSAYSFTANFPINKTYTVSLKYDDNLGNCVSNHSNVFRIGNETQTHIEAVRDTTSPEFKFIFSYPKPNPSHTYVCSWKFPDGTSSMFKPSRTFQQPGTYVIELMIIDQITSDTCFSFYQLHVTDNISCDANYRATFSPIVNSSIMASATVLLTQTDGTVFSSRMASQPASSNFEILSVSDYKTDAKGNRTKSLSIQFNCVVKNGNRNITLTNAEGIIAVGYKP